MRFNSGIRGTLAPLAAVASVASLTACGTDSREFEFAVDCPDELELNVVDVNSNSLRPSLSLVCGEGDDVELPRSVEIHRSDQLDITDQPSEDDSRLFVTVTAGNLDGGISLREIEISEPLGEAIIRFSVGDITAVFAD